MARTQFAPIAEMIDEPPLPRIAARTCFVLLIASAPLYRGRLCAGADLSILRPVLSRPSFLCFAFHPRSRRVQLRKRSFHGSSWR
jgi:hypothetical protein